MEKEKVLCAPPNFKNTCMHVFQPYLKVCANEPIRTILWALSDSLHQLRTGRHYDKIVKFEFLCRFKLFVRVQTRCNKQRMAIANLLPARMLLLLAHLVVAITCLHDMVRPPFLWRQYNCHFSPPPFIPFSFTILDQLF